MVPDYGKSQHENHSHSKTRLLLRSEILSGMCAKLHTVAASNNKDHPTRSLSSSPLAPTVNCSPGSQALLEVTYQDHSIGITRLLLVRATYIWCFFTHIPFVVNHTSNATPPEGLQQHPFRFLQQQSHFGHHNHRKASRKTHSTNGVNIMSHVTYNHTTQCEHVNGLCLAGWLNEQSITTCWFRSVRTCPYSWATGRKSWTDDRFFLRWETCDPALRLSHPVEDSPLFVPILVTAPFWIDQKSWAACAQSFALWQQATIEITRRDHSRRDR